MEDEKILTEDIRVAEELNSFQTCIVKDLKSPEYSETNPIAEEIANQILKSELKYNKHRSATAIRKLNIRCHFQFSFVSFAEALKEITKINPRKAAQSTDIPVKILKDNGDIFSDYICEFFNESFNCCKFPSILKRANVTTVFKKVIMVLKRTIVQLVYCLQCQKIFKSYYVNNLKCCRSKSFKISVRL